MQVDSSKVKIAIEIDNLKPKRKMIVIRDGIGAIVGIPLRDASDDEAVRHLNCICYAFETGVRHTQDVMHEAMYRLWIDVTSSSFDP